MVLEQVGEGGCVRTGIASRDVGERDGRRVFSTTQKKCSETGSGAHKGVLVWKKTTAKKTCTLISNTASILIVLSNDP